MHMYDCRHRSIRFDVERGTPEESGGVMSLGGVWDGLDVQGLAVERRATTPARVSVIIVNYRGADDTIACVEGLADLDWPREQLEVIVVDNASGDGSVERIRAAAPDVTLDRVEEEHRVRGWMQPGGRGGDRRVPRVPQQRRPSRCRTGSSRRSPMLERRAGVACVASRVLDWEGTEIDFAAASMSFYGHGFKMHAGDPDVAAHDEEADVLFASGAAMVIDAGVFDRVGRLRRALLHVLRGRRPRVAALAPRVRGPVRPRVVRLPPAPRVDVDASASWREHYLLERNALFTIYKNYDDENLRAVLPAALTLTIGRSVVRGGDDPHMLEVSKAVADEPTTAFVHKETLAGPFAVDAFLSELDDLTDHAARAPGGAATSRRRDPAVVPPAVPPQLRPAAPSATGTLLRCPPSASRTASRRRRRILVATGDSLQPAMAGPAIRAWQIARALSREHDVELVSTTKCEDLSHPDFRVRKVNGHQFRKLVDWCDIVIFQGYIMFENPAIAKSSKVVVADIYDPFHLEQLEQTARSRPGRPSQRRAFGDRRAQRAARAG